MGFKSLFWVKLLNSMCFLAAGSAKAGNTIQGGSFEVRYNIYFFGGLSQHWVVVRRNRQLDDNGRSVLCTL